MDRFAHKYSKCDVIAQRKYALQFQNEKQKKNGRKKANDECIVLNDLAQIDAPILFIILMDAFIV